MVLINKIDLLPYLDFNTTAFSQAVTGLNPAVKTFQVSCKTGEGMEAWFSWLEDEIKQLKNSQSSQIRALKDVVTKTSMKA